MQGTIATLTGKGFGFIKPVGQDSEEEKDLFFHSSELQGVQFDDLNVGDAVTFDMEDSEKGPKAVNVARAEATA